MRPGSQQSDRIVDELAHVERLRVDNQVAGLDLRVVEQIVEESIGLRPLIVVAGLHVALPASYRVHPAWLALVVPVALLVVLIVGDPGRIDRQKTWLRVVTGVVIAFINLANLFAAVRLVVDILTNNKIFVNHPGGLLAAGGVIWVTNVVAFGLWYWDLDRGGAAARAHHPDRNPAFVFPEMQHSDYVPAGWVPRFIDSTAEEGTMMMDPFSLSPS